MKSLLKKLNLNDYLLVILLIIPFFPLTPIPFIIGHTYYFELLLLIYGIINLLNGILKSGDLKKSIKNNIIHKTFLIFFIFVILNIVFSFFHALNLNSKWKIPSLKIHINILRGFIEFFIIFIFAGKNLKHASYFKVNRFLISLTTVLAANLLIPLVIMVFKVNIIKVISDPEYYLFFREAAGKQKINLPDGAYALFLLCWIYYLFFNRKKKIYIITGIVLTILGLLSIFITYSRIFLPAVIFLLFFQIILLMNKKARIYLIIILLILLMISSNVIKKRMLAKVKDYSSLSMGSGRLYLLGSVFRLIKNKKNLSYGIGLGNYFKKSRKFIIHQRFRGFTTPHNQFLTILIGSGILGYLLFFYFIVLLIFEGTKKIRNSNNRNKIFWVSNLSIILCFILMSLFADMIISFHPPMTHYLLFLWVFMSINASQDKLIVPHE